LLYLVVYYAEEEKIHEFILNETGGER
jgi:hypothetical protein